MTEKEIVNGWCDRFFINNRKGWIFPNVFFAGFEADILEITGSGYCHEIEVKISRADFLGDMKKSRAFVKGIGENVIKHEQIQSGKRVNRFSYVVPEGLVTPEEVPEYAGLFYAKKYPCTNYELLICTQQKGAPPLTVEKFTNPLETGLKSCYYRFHELRKNSLA
jgi:hypothetical protein